jgi:hypothetical protein
MSSPDDPRVWEFYHVIRLAQGVADRQADLLRQALVVGKRQAAHVRQAERLASAIVSDQPQDGLPGVPVKPHIFDPVQAVWNLRVGECPDSSIWFQIDCNGVWFTLGARLGELLKFLVSQSEEDRSSDELVGFRARADVLAHLQKTGGREYDPQYVNKLVNKLQDKLSIHDKRILIVTNRQKGVRFLIKRGAVKYMRLDEAPVKYCVAGPRQTQSSA